MAERWPPTAPRPPGHARAASDTGGAPLPPQPPRGPQLAAVSPLAAAFELHSAASAPALLRRQQSAGSHSSGGSGWTYPPTPSPGSGGSGTGAAPSPWQHAQQHSQQQYLQQQQQQYHRGAGAAEAPPPPQPYAYYPPQPDTAPERDAGGFGGLSSRGGLGSGASGASRSSGSGGSHPSIPPAAAAVGPPPLPPPLFAGGGGGAAPAAGWGAPAAALAGWLGKPPPAAARPPPLQQQHQHQQRASPLQVGAMRMGAARAVWSPRAPPNPFRRVFSPLALALLLAYLAALGYYLYVRFAFSLNMGSQTWYGVLVLLVELLGVTSVLPYGLLLPVATLSAGTKGLPIDDGRVVLPPEKRFRVHILVPCYKESLEVVTNTVTAALAAEVPPGVTRTLYLCDDGKDEAKRAFITALGPEARYVSGRKRRPGETNGKSANVNHCLRHVIFPDHAPPPDCAEGDGEGGGEGGGAGGDEERGGGRRAAQASDISPRELVVVFDADMAARRNFLLKVLEVMWDDGVSLVLTPQAFRNINPRADIFNNINQQFWQYVLPGCDAWGYVACTGTNFCIRARALAQVGWFPEYTITEDYALSMELKAAGLRGRYLAEYLAVGEAPDEVRNVCRQRSRWTKGHMQIFFSRRCPLLNGRLPLVHRVLYTNGTWAYFTTILTTLTFLLVPFLSLALNLHPVNFCREFALAATLYLPASFALMSYAREPRHLRGQWMAQVSNHLLAFTYFKAVVNTLLSIVGFKAKAGFKATDKQGGGAAAALKSLGGAPGGGSGVVPQAAVGLLPASAAGSAPPLPPLSAAAAGVLPPPRQPERLLVGRKVVVGADGVRRLLPARPLTKAELIQHELRAAEAARRRPRRRGCWAWVNARTLEGALDPLWLALSLCVSLAALGAGVYSAIRAGAFSARVESWGDFAEIFTSGRVDVYLLVPMLWALYNAIPPLLFFVYFFTKGRLLQGLCSFAQAAGVVLAAAAVAGLWLGMLVPYRGAVGPAPARDFGAYVNAAVSRGLSNVPRLPHAAGAPGGGA